MKIFISLPMRGRTDEEISVEINRIHSKYGKNDTEFIDSFIEKDIKDGYKTISLAYLARSLDLMAKADMVVFAKGWKEARGCKIEHQCAVDYEIPFIEED